jgi:hypothetical protein
VNSEFDTAKVNFEICRPGTTEQHISQHPYGYFTETIHLDVHWEFQGSSGYVRACSGCPFHIIFLCSTRKTNKANTGMGHLCSGGWRRMESRCRIPTWVDVDQERENEWKAPATQP